MTESVIELDEVSFTWPGSKSSVIDIRSFSMERGSRVFLRGPSGSGKTTLLSLISAVIMPQHGQVRVCGVDISEKRGAAGDRFRADHIGLIFQQFNLLPFLNVVDNVILPCRFSRQRRQRASSKRSLTAEAHRLLRSMRLPDEIINARSTMLLSVGQQQRIAAARALIGQPDLIIADEPTSALDTETRAAFIDLLFDEVSASQASLLFVSHDESLAAAFDQSLDLTELNRALPTHNAPDDMSGIQASTH